MTRALAHLLLRSNPDGEPVLCAAAFLAVETTKGPTGAGCWIG